MPMPTRQEGETKREFIERFMQNPRMIKEYPDSAQRAAVANKEWERQNR